MVSRTTRLLRKDLKISSTAFVYWILMDDWLGLVMFEVFIVYRNEILNLLNAKSYFLA